MIFAALSEAADRGELLLVSDGMCRFHRRRDGVVVIREILVLPFCRRTGIGRRLVGQIRERFPRCAIQARCPVDYLANQFWSALGFTLIDCEDGVNLWQCPP